MDKLIIRDPAQGMTYIESADGKMVATVWNSTGDSSVFIPKEEAQKYTNAFASAPELLETIEKVNQSFKLLIKAFILVKKALGVFGVRIDKNNLIENMGNTIQKAKGGLS